MATTVLAASVATTAEAGSEAETETQTQTEMPACTHYRRGCRVLAACCGQWVGCRRCHDETYADHAIDRHAIQRMQCLTCGTEQPCARECSGCGRVMGDYYCAVCHYFDDDGASKQVFHCDDCGICRVGGRANYFHCKPCGGCYPPSLKDNHRCVLGSMYRECAICLEVTFASTESVHVLPCGHVLHRRCFEQYVKHGFSECPTCRGDMFHDDRPTEPDKAAANEAPTDVDDTNTTEPEAAPETDEAPEANATFETEAATETPAAAAPTEMATASDQDHDDASSAPES